MAIFSNQMDEENEISPDKNTSDGPTIPPEELARQKARQKARTVAAENRPSS
jgi:predicted house-cleaning NTP pyrophosphatase (Maf/HAM1 superfamily)